MDLVSLQRDLAMRSKWNIGFFLSGLVFWNFFNTTANQILTSVMASSGVLKSINVPTLIFPISSLISSLINLGLSLIPFFVLMFFFGFTPSVKSIQFIYVLIMFTSFTLGFGLLLCAYNVYFRDVGMLWQTVTPAFFYFTPIVWDISMLAEGSKMAFITKLNPIYHFMAGFRSSLYSNEWMGWFEFGIISGLGISLLLIGYFVFSKMEKGFYSHY